MIQLLYDPDDKDYSLWSIEKGYTAAWLSTHDTAGWDWDPNPPYPHYTKADIDPTKDGWHVDANFLLIAEFDTVDMYKQWIAEHPEYYV